MEECHVLEVVFESYPPAVAVVKATVVDPLPEEQSALVSFRFCDMGKPLGVLAQMRNPAGRPFAAVPLNGSSGWAGGGT
jgi:hypothetical protein